MARRALAQRSLRQHAKETDEHNDGQRSRKQQAGADAEAPPLRHGDVQARADQTCGAEYKNSGAVRDAVDKVWCDELGEEGGYHVGEEHDALGHGADEVLGGREDDDVEHIIDEACEDVVKAW
ncbi:hypothetical protein BBAD15_g7134 [Beauveria bassiana D1-5]|uniref:Uncharacterized protein n=1 Tax=Beauveria bassiana D1-5 TaxID=1245745 RepID=A0A0A2VI12_BEABA|nr:hypothetical protein BBAD15_g7134 [Beauveria bassiana D1-5]